MMSPDNGARRPRLRPSPGPALAKSGPGVRAAVSRRVGWCPPHEIGVAKVITQPILCFSETKLESTAAGHPPGIVAFSGRVRRTERLPRRLACHLPPARVDAG